VQGLFHLRWGVGDPLDVYAPPDSVGCADLHKNNGLLRFHRLTKFAPFQLGDLVITPVPLIHSKPTFGYCLEQRGQRVAYLTDTCGLPPNTREFLIGWRPHAMILDCTHPPRAEVERNTRLTEALAIGKDLGVDWCRAHPASRYGSQHPEALPASVSLARDEHSCASPAHECFPRSHSPCSCVAEPVGKAGGANGAFLWWAVGAHILLFAPWTLPAFAEAIAADPVLGATVLVTGLANGVYFIALRHAYRLAPAGAVYPLARSAPLLVALGETLLFGRVLPPMAWAGVALSVFGLWLIAFDTRAHAHGVRRALPLPPWPPS
jgi:hypothetical protein